MKRILMVVLIVMANSLLAQKNLYKQVTEQLKKEYPDISLENKLIIINTWSVSDQQKREFNIQMNKALATFESAKLKGGVKGIIGVVLNTTDDSKLETITLNKDKVTAALKLEEAGLDLEGVSNLVFDSQGNIVYSALQPGAVFNSIHQLITR